MHFLQSMFYAGQERMISNLSKGTGYHMTLHTLISCLMSPSKEKYLAVMYGHSEKSNIL